MHCDAQSVIAVISLIPRKGFVLRNKNYCIVYCIVLYQGINTVGEPPPPQHQYPPPQPSSQCDTRAIFTHQRDTSGSFFSQLNFPTLVRIPFYGPLVMSRNHICLATITLRQMTGMIEILTRNVEVLLVVQHGGSGTITSAAASTSITIIMVTS